MIRSIRGRLLVTMMAIVVLLIAVIAILFQRATDLELHRLAASGDLAREAAVRGRLQQLWAADGSWNDAPRALGELERATGWSVILVAGGRAIASNGAPFHSGSATNGANGDTAIRSSDEGRTLFLRFHAGPQDIIRNAAGTEVGRFFVIEKQAAHRTEPSRGLRDTLVIISAAVALAGILAVAAIAATITGPLERLTRAVRDWQEGNPPPALPDDDRGDEVGRLASAFHQLAARLSRNEQLRRNLLSDVTHELRTPLANMRGELEAAEDGLMATDRELVRSLAEEVVHLARLVDDLQQLALAEAGQLRMDVRPVELHAIVSRASSTVSAIADAKRVRIENRVEDAVVIADVDRLIQVFRNLLENAIRHSPEGDRIVIDSAPGNGAVTVRVIDRGPGIAADELPLIFERFYRADPSRARESGGAGLGLPIARALVELLGGTLLAESTPGHGATFLVALPLSSSILQN